MTDIEKMYAPFSITNVRKKVAYCNNNIIPLLKKYKIKWDMNTMRIIFRGKRFPMKNIDNGKAEEFINSLIDSDRQSSLDLWR